MEKAVDMDGLVGSPEWNRDVEDGSQRPEIDTRLQDGDELVDGELIVHSLSGKERNHLFINQQTGSAFDDVSAISGMDSVSDSRCFALIDYDHDGWQDVVLANANHPLTQLFHNDIAQLKTIPGGVIALRFVGGNTVAEASAFSNRNGYGAMVTVNLADGTAIKREHRCGEGYAAQNSSTMLIGIGANKMVADVSVRWPSGRTTSTGNIPEGALLTAYENRPGQEFKRAAYRNVRRRASFATTGEKFRLAQSVSADLHVYTTMATWCAACAGHLPQIELLKADDVAVFGVPVDPDDDSKKLSGYVESRQPAYTLLQDVEDSQRESLEVFLQRKLSTKNVPLPSSVITDGSGTVLQVMTGIPSVSDLRRLLPGATESR